MRGILIDPVAQHISVIDVAKGLAAIYAAIGCSCIDIVALGEGADMFVDDEGRLKDGARCFAIPGARGQLHIIAGRALILASDAQGETIATAVPLAPIEAMVRWLPVDFDYTPPPPVVITFDSLDMLKFIAGGR